MLLALPLVLGFGCAHPKEEAKVATTTPSAASSGVKAPSESAPSGGNDATAKDDACTDVHVHFALDSTDIADPDKPRLEKSAGCLKQDKKLHVTIEGNADERGTEEYNLALGDRRARAVAQYLERLGVSGTQLKTVSYGKEQPECTDHTEACWSQNRRAAVKPTTFRN
jgi:peptidoglycan-associated lipoprotein